MLKMYKKDYISYQKHMSWTGHFLGHPEFWSPQLDAWRLCCLQGTGSCRWRQAQAEQVTGGPTAGLGLGLQSCR